MDPDILQILARPAPEPAPDEATRQEDVKRRRLEGLAKAREARLENRKSAAEQAALQRSSPAELGMLALTVPGCGHLAQRTKVSPELQMRAVQKLAFSPRVRGSGKEVERVRLLQDSSVALVGSLYLERQSAGFKAWLVTAKQQRENNSGPYRVHALSAMWDEASQKARGLLSQSMSGKVITKSQKAVEVMVLLAAVFRADLSQSADGSVASDAAPMLLGSTGHGHILAALRRLLPVDMLSRDSLEAFDDSADVSIICFAFDSASGNIATYSYLAYLVERSTAATVLFHGQRCLTHQIHIIRSASVTLSGAAGVLYSLSKLMQHSNSTLALHAGIVNHARDNLQIREGAAPENSDFLRVALGMFGVDGDWSLVSAGEKRKVTPFSARLADLCQHCRYDLKSKTWLYFTGVAPARSNRPGSRDAEHLEAPRFGVLGDTVGGRGSQPMDRDFASSEEGCAGFDVQPHIAGLPRSPFAANGRLGRADRDRAEEDRRSGPLGQGGGRQLLVADCQSRQARGCLLFRRLSSVAAGGASGGEFASRALALALVGPGRPGKKGYLG